VAEGIPYMAEKVHTVSKANPHGLDDNERTRTEIWSRVMGYHRPISGWNIGKKAEYAERRYFKEPKEVR